MKTLPPALLILALLVSPAVLAADAKPNLQPIFNGKDLAGWKDAVGNKYWRVEKGVLICENDAAMKANYLWTEKEYRDFVIEFDVRWKGETPRGVDTGVEMRQPSLQLQLGVSGSLRVDMSGSFYLGKAGYPEHARAKEAKKLMKPEGQWNTFRIQAKGDTFTCWINGKKASEFTDPKYPGAAPIGLQLHGNVKMKAEYRNIRLAVL